MAELVVDYADLLSAAREVSEAVGELGGLIKGLMPEWGAALGHAGLAQCLGVFWEQWSAQCAGVLEFLEALAQVMDRAVGVFESADAASAQAFVGVLGGGR